MSIYNLPKARKMAKQPEALKGISKHTAYVRYAKAHQLKKELKKKLKKCEFDIGKYVATIIEIEREERKQ